MAIGLFNTAPGDYARRFCRTSGGYDGKPPSFFAPTINLLWQSRSLFFINTVKKIFLTIGTRPCIDAARQALPDSTSHIGAD
jgi:hypothetical protein